MSYRSKIIYKLLNGRQNREDYVNAKLNQVIPSQIKALRLRELWTQAELGEKAEMKQARISAMESPGAVNFTLQTLVRLAAAFNVGLWVEFVSYSELLRKENEFSQDTFGPVRLQEDRRFLDPSSAVRNDGVGFTASPIYEPLVRAIDEKNAACTVGSLYPPVNQDHRMIAQL